MEINHMIGVVCFCIANIFYSNAQTISVLAKNETFISPQKDMIVMDKYTFAKYHYTAEQCDSLKKEALNYDSTVEWMNSVTQEVEQGYKKLLTTKDKEIQAYSQSYTALKSTLQQSVEEQNKLQVAYLKLQQKQSRVKKWRNLFLGTTAVLAGVLVLIVR
jgi:hypothetical protein